MEKQIVYQGENGEPTTNTLLISQFFGKIHASVVEKVEDLALKSSQDFSSHLRSMFRQEYYLDGSNRQQRMYVMNRDGFTLLVMGFTGKKALKFKLQYIDAFNKMEAKIKEQEENNKPNSLLGALEQSVQVLKEQDRRIGKIEGKVNLIETRTATDPERFSVVGYARWNEVQITTKTAAAIGRTASSICKRKGWPMGRLRDPRWGMIREYPEKALEIAFINHIPEFINAKAS